MVRSKGDFVNFGLQLLIAAVITWLAAQVFVVWNLFPGLKHLRPAAWVRFGILLFPVLAAWLMTVAPKLLSKILALWFRLRAPLKWGRWVFAFLIAVGVPVVALWVPAYSKVIGVHDPTSVVAVWGVTYLLAALGIALFIAEGDKPQVTAREAAVALLASASAFAFLGAYTKVSSYPFSLSWSEGNRFWDYSLMFGRSRYIYPAGKPIPAHISPGRQFLWGLIYLIPNVDIFWVRLWSAIVFTVPYLIFAATVFWKPKQARRAGLVAALWGFLFLRQGPIYTPLLLSAWLIVLAVDAPLWLGVPLAAVAGYYAAITRFTWVLAPFLWMWMLTAGASPDRKALRRAWKPFLWMGSFALIGALASGNWRNLFDVAFGILHKFIYGSAPAGEFAARQPLIWGRLFPNPTFQPGILLGVTLAILPILALLVIWWKKGLWRLNRIALISDMLIMLALFAVGIVASLKIGGGSNLHNLDMFLVSVLLMVLIAWRQGVWEWAVSHKWALSEKWLTILLVVVPMYFVALGLSPHQVPAKRWWQPDLRAIQHFVNQAQSKPGEILFMDQRQLLTFGYIKGVPLVPEYEKKLMMDEAMAGDKKYFAKYYYDLATKRFSLMVTPVLKVNYQNESSHNFASENNAWDKWVAAPTLCYYKPIYKSNLGFALLVPREGKVDCSAVLPVQPSAP